MISEVTDIKKVLHIAESFAGGVLVYIAELCNSQAEEFDVTVAYARRKHTPEDFSGDFSKKIAFMELKHAQRQINPVKDLRMLFEVRKIVAQVRPDIIHLHSSKAGFIGRLAVNCKKISVLYTPHGYGFQQKSVSHLQRILYRFLERLASLAHATTLCIGRNECQLAKSLNTRRRALYVNNGIGLNSLNLPVLLPPRNSALKIGGMGRLDVQKNPALFNEIARALPQYEFIWIGGGDLAPILNARNITISGWIPREEALAQLNELDIFLITSLWEGLPFALLEAMYLKKICICSDIESSYDVVCHGENGFIAKTVSDYVSVIESVGQGKLDIERITESAHRNIIEKFSSNAMCKQIKQVYREILSHEVKVK